MINYISKHGYLAPDRRHRLLTAVALSLLLHVLVVGGLTGFLPQLAGRAPAPQRAAPVVAVLLAPPPPPRAEARVPQAAPTQSPRATQVAISPSPQALLTQPAPPAPSAEEWAFAAGYTIRNSKGYRYNWGRHVRSLMGTAVDGPDQGVVRFRVTIAADGRLAGLETLWTTSEVAEQRARQAIAALPALPPTPTGRPLVFERTISFSPFVSDSPPMYRNDCRPEPPGFRNPFAQGAHAAAPQDESTQDPPQSLEECLRQLPQDSIEAEAAHDQRQLDRWRSNRIGP